MRFDRHMSSHKLSLGASQLFSSVAKLEVEKRFSGDFKREHRQRDMLVSILSSS